MRNALLVALAVVLQITLIACGGTAGTAGQPSAPASIPDFRTTPEPVVPTSTAVPDFRTTPEPYTDVTLLGAADYLKDFMDDYLSLIRILKRMGSVFEAEGSPRDQAESLRGEFRKVTRLYDEWGRRPAPVKRLRLLRKLWLLSLSRWSKAGAHYVDWLATGDEQEKALGNAAARKAGRAGAAAASEFERVLGILRADSPP